MVSPFHMSIFYDLLFKKKTNEAPTQLLGGYTGSKFPPDARLEDLTYVVFDFETTGLDTRSARIIEIGGIKYQNKKEIGRFSTFVKPKATLNADITEITGITWDMIKDAPSIEEVLPEFHEFLRGCVGIAHNAEFDHHILHHESARLGMSCDYTILCTLKMARELIIDIERRNLDTLAQYYNLTFQERHRSIGDILVTAEVFFHMLKDNSSLQNLEHMGRFRQYLEAN
jgi:DNA polymerase III epsilon subunit family exonuclease